MTTFHEQTVTCPCCNEEVIITLLTSTNSFGKRTDFHSITGGFPPIPLQMNTCPTCGFSGSANDFLNPKLSPELKEKIQTYIKPMLYDAPLKAGRRYELYAEIRKLEGDTELELANRYLVAAWAAVDEGTDDEKAHRQKAIDYFRKALNKNQVPENSEANITYLVGELYRRIGDSDSARTWFNRVEVRAQSDETWEDIAKIAIQQRDNPKDRF